MPIYLSLDKEKILLFPHPELRSYRDRAVYYIKSDELHENIIDLDKQKF